MPITSYWFAPRPKGVEHQHPVLVFDRDDQLHVPLTVFAKKFHDGHAASSMRTYLYAILPFFTFLDTDPHLQDAGITWDSPPDGVRTAVEAYLHVRLNCKVIDRTERGYMLVQPTEDLNPDTLRGFLTAIKTFYRIMRKLRFYLHDNPLVDVEFPERRAEAYVQADQNGTPRMSNESGITGPGPRIRLTDSFFKLRFEQWVPQTVDDITLPAQVFTAGRAAGWGLRERSIAHLLFETGARISEILGLRLLEWVAQNAGPEAYTFNKGNHGRRTKWVKWSDDTNKLLELYVDTERRRFDPDGLTISTALTRWRGDPKDPALKRPIFLTERRTQLQPISFRNHFWRPTCLAAGLNVDPHQARHWYVTQMIRTIYLEATTEAEVDAGIANLISYMSWRAGEDTMQAYQHHFNKERHVERQQHMFERMYAPITAAEEHDPLPGNASAPRHPTLAAPAVIAFLDDENEEEEFTSLVYRLGGWK